MTREQEDAAMRDASDELRREHLELEALRAAGKLGKGRARSGKRRWAVKKALQQRDQESR